jgi:hypothetical protein
MLNSMKLTQFAGGIACSTNDEASVTAWNKACMPIQDKGWTLKQSLLNNFLSAMYENSKNVYLQMVTVLLNHAVKLLSILGQILQSKLESFRVKLWNMQTLTHSSIHIDESY